MNGALRDELAEKIVDAAVAEAERAGNWHHVSLRGVADNLGIGLVEVGRRFRDKDAIADAWFDRARHAVLAAADEELVTRPVRERLFVLFCRWFETLAPHRVVTVQMIQAKLWPFHPHHWAPLAFNLSRTILWIRDAAGMRAESPRSEIEEIGLTWLFVAALAVWARDPTPDQQRTRRFLDQRLRDADCVMRLLFGRRASDADAVFAASDPATQDGVPLPRV